MAEQRIISKVDINEFFQLDSNIDDSRINPHILRAQQAELKPVLGDALYYAFIEDYDGTNFQDQRFIDLFEGAIYQDSKGNPIYFNGVRPLLSSWSFSRVVGANKIFITRSGNVQQINPEESENLEDNQIRLYKREARSEAIRLEGELILFLQANKETYPEYQYWYEGITKKKTSFTFRPLGRLSTPISTTGRGGTIPTPPGPASTFLELTDTPNDYTGQAGLFTRVNSTEDGLEFAVAGGDFWATSGITNIAANQIVQIDMAKATSSNTTEVRIGHNTNLFGGPTFLGEWATVSILDDEVNDLYKIEMQTNRGAQIWQARHNLSASSSSSNFLTNATGTNLTLQISGQTNLNGGSLTFRRFTTLLEEIRIDNSGITIEDALNSRGVSYAADYSAEFNDRSLIDKGYADSTFWALSGNSNLTGATDIILGANDLSFQNTGTGGTSLLQMTAATGDIQITGVSTPDNSTYQMSLIIGQGIVIGYTTSPGAADVGLELSSQIGNIFRDDAFNIGLAYAADYSANFFDESLVTKRYVDAQAGGGGAFTSDVNTQITPTTPILLDQATGNEIALDLSFTANKATSGDVTGILMNITDTDSPGALTPFLYQLGGTEKLRVGEDGDVIVANSAGFGWGSENDSSFQGITRVDTSSIALSPNSTHNFNVKVSSSANNQFEISTANSTHLIRFGTTEEEIILNGSAQTGQLVINNFLAQQWSKTDITFYEDDGTSKILVIDRAVTAGSGIVFTRTPTDQASGVSVLVRDNTTGEIKIDSAR